MRFCIGILCCLLVILAPVAVAAPADADSNAKGQVVLADGDALLLGMQTWAKGATPECPASLSIGSGQGAPGSTGNPVGVFLTNSETVGAISFGVTDTPNALASNACSAIAAGYSCTATDDGASVTVSFSGGTIPESTGLEILRVLYDVDAAAAAGTSALDLSNVTILSEGGSECDVTATSGSFETLTVCGNGVVEDGEECDGSACCAADCTYEEAGATCDDGSFCSVDDTCDGVGTCLAGTDRDCGDDDICTDDSCDDEADTCVNEEDQTNDPSCEPSECGNGIVEGLEDCDDGNTDGGDCCAADCIYEATGSTCDDGSFCSVDDTCDGAGTCEAGADRDCGDEDICTDDSCDDETDSCVNEEDVTNDPSCEPAECGNGVLEEGEDCDDGNTDDGDCCASDCTLDEAGATCDDGSFCSVDDTCDGAGVCQAGADRDCGDDDICTDDSCDDEADTCVNEEDQTNDPSCEPSECGNGIVEGLEDCDDGNTDGGDCCAADCTYEATGSTCDDGSFCSVDDTCDGAGACEAGGDRDCNDEDICTDDFCDDEADSCVNEEDVTNDPSCEPAECGNGIVEEGEECDGSDCCAADCTYSEAGTTCDDGSFCSVDDTCDGAGTCEAGADRDCGDDDICTDDSCDDEADACVNEEDITNDPSCEPAECGNGIVEEGEDCDDGNTDDGDCCSANCTYDDAGAACDDGEYCTADDACDGAGTCMAGGDRDCNDDDVCTTDSCDEEGDTCVNDFDAGLDPVCERARAMLGSSATCGFGLSTTEVCFDLVKAADDGMDGGADDVTAVDWCLNWDQDSVEFSCDDEDQDGVPDDLAVFVDPAFSTIVRCTPDDAVCGLRVSILDKQLPLDVLPDDTLACATFSVLPGVAEGESELPFGEASASDTLGASVPLETVSDSISLDSCCLADCNGDDLVDIADAVSVILELSDKDGNDACNTGADLPFDGQPCCDCNLDSKIDIADAVCIVNGLGELQCPATAVSPASIAADAAPQQTEMTGESFKSSTLPDIEAKQGLTLVQKLVGWNVVVPVIFEQDLDDQRVGGRDEISAFSTCIDFDQNIMELDTTDADADGIPDVVDIRLPASHAAFVKVDLSRSACEIHLGVLDLSKPSAALPDGQLAEIEFQMIGRAAGRGVWIRPGESDTRSFSDVMGVSQPVQMRAITGSASNE